MRTFAHVVVAVDGSNPSQAATAFALTLAAREGARVSFCSAVDPVTTYVAAAESAAIDLGATVAALRDEARGVCLEAMTRAAAHGVDAVSSVIDGNPVDVLERFAEQNAGEAIVVGTHGRRGVARAILGSVACEMVRSARIPVFIVRAEAATDWTGPIVVAVDSSPPSRAALRIATALARSQQTALHLVHVFDDHDLGRVYDHPGYDPLIARRQAMAEATDEMAEITDGLRALRVRFASEMCEGDPVAETLASAARVKARFIATGTHARNAFGRLYFGSVAEGLLREAPVPVMTVRARRT